MAKGWGLAYRISLTGDIEVARAPTQNELGDLLHQLMEWRGANAEWTAGPVGADPTDHRMADVAVSMDPPTNPADAPREQRPKGLAVLIE